MRAKAIYLAKAAGRRLRWGGSDFLRRRREGPLAPPRRLAFVGAGDYEQTGLQFLGYFRELGGLQPGDRVLDVGSGIGRMAMPLTGYLDGGSYAGFDVGRGMVRWCSRTITPRWPSFEFAWAPVHNGKYNPFGNVPGAEFRFPYADAEFDFAFATSLYTHLLPDEVGHYLAETARVLKPGATCLLTFFLLTPEAEAEIAAGRSMLDFSDRIEGGRTTDPAQPEEAIAFPTADIRAQLAAVGLKVLDPIHHGLWSNTPGGLTLQDIVVAERVG
jgi:SAM-dependent methyltransferase